MVGHVQSRKARQAGELADLIHSVDTLKLARRISEFALEQDRRIPVLLQVNSRVRKPRAGFPRTVAEVIHEALELGGMEVRGFMTMAPFVEDERILRRPSAGFGGFMRRQGGSRGTRARSFPWE